MPVTVIGNKLQVEVLADESTKTQLNEIQQEVSDLEERLDERVDTIIAGTVEGVSGAEIVDARQGEVSLGANITKVKSQLAEKAKRTEVFLKSKGININDMDEPTRQTFLEAQSIDVNYVLGEGNVKPKNTSFFENSSNLFDKDDIIMDKYVNYYTGEWVDSTVYISSNYITVDSNSEYIVKFIREYAFYDANKQFINGESNDDSPFENKVFTTPPNARYLIISWTKSGMTIHNQQVNKGNTILPYETYRQFIPKEFTEKHPFDTEDIEDGSITINKTDFVTLGKNLFDKSKATSGYVVHDGNGTIYENANYYASDYIEIEPSKEYTQNFGYFSAFYDENKVFISGLDNAQSHPRTFTSPANAKYIRMSSTVAVLDSIQLELGSVVTPYESYGYRFTKTIPDTEDLVDGSITANKTDFVELGNNLFNKDAVTNDYYITMYNGQLVAGAGWWASDFIEVKPNTPYYFSYARDNAWFDDNKNFISGDDLTGSRMRMSPANAKYFRFSGYNWPTDNVMMNEGEQPLPFESYGYKFVKEIEKPSDMVNQFNVEINLPKNMYGLVGEELNIYFDNVISGRDTDYDFDIDCSIGAQYDNFYRVSPSSAGNFPLTLKVIKNNVVINQKSTTIIVSDKSVGNGITRKVMVIGDSTTANGIVVTKLIDNLQTDVFKINAVGTKGTGEAKHEGISGWTISQYVTSVDSPFVFNGSFDFNQYITTNSIPLPDYVILNLGINDVFTYQSDESVNAKINEFIYQYEQAIANIHQYNPSIKIGVALTIPPAYDQSSFGKAYGNNYTRVRYKRNNFLLVKRLIEVFESREGDNIHLVPIHTNLDTRFNMGLEELPVNARNTTQKIVSIISNGNCHPDTSGYWQTADVYWYWLKSFEE